MSWSFAVTNVDPVDAIREFNNTVFDNMAHMPREIADTLNDTATRLAATVKTGQGCTLRTNGHLEQDGTGTCHVEITIRKLSEAEKIMLHEDRRSGRRSDPAARTRSTDATLDAGEVGEPPGAS